jgi:hypothetical protein
MNRNQLVRVLSKFSRDRVSKWTFDAEFNSLYILLTLTRARLDGFQTSYLLFRPRNDDARELTTTSIIFFDKNF